MLDNLEVRLFRYRIITVDNHWLWAGALNSKGYGQLTIDGKQYEVHRLSAYLYLGLNLDNSNEWACHKDNICRFKDCWNPDHLYKGDKNSNSNDRSKFVTHCPQGHEYNEDNIKYEGNAKHCKECNRIRSRNRYRRNHPEIIRKRKIC
jgi:hypothetical protein